MPKVLRDRPTIFILSAKGAILRTILLTNTFIQWPPSAMLLKDRYSARYIKMIKMMNTPTTAPRTMPWKIRSVFDMHVAGHEGTSAS